MLNVKRTFFLTKAEVDSLRKITGLGDITERAPHYELENGTIIYAQAYESKIYYKEIG